MNGHKHVSGYGIVKCPSTGILSHCCQIASYKVLDRYAKELGLRDQHISPCGVTIIDPYARAETGLVQFFRDPEVGADYFSWLRSRA